MYTVCYLKDLDFRFKTFEDKNEANKAAVTLINMKLPVMTFRPDLVHDEPKFFNCQKNFFLNRMLKSCAQIYTGDQDGYFISQLIFGLMAPGDECVYLNGEAFYFEERYIKQDEMYAAAYNIYGGYDKVSIITALYLTADGEEMTEFYVDV